MASQRSGISVHFERKQPHEEAQEVASATNVVIRDMEFQYAALGPIFEQLKDIPDGTHVAFKIKR
jgi:hypothetical protein